MARVKQELDIRDLVGVAVAADLRNFKLAAEQLNTTQSTLSRQVARVESELNVTIFRRGWSGTETTREGDLVCQFARAIREVLAASEQRLFSDRSSHPRFETSLTLTHLEVIEAVRRTRGATAAASELSRNQSSISRALSDVQQHLGLTLFSRTMRGLEPLPAALEFSDLYERISRILENLRAQLTREQGQLAGRVAIGVLPFSMQRLIARAFAEISERHPQTRLVLVPGTYPSFVRALRHGEIEGVVGIMRNEKCPQDLVETPLLEENFTIVARADHPLHQTARTIEDLADVRWLVPPHGSPVRAFIEQVFVEHGITPQLQTCEIQLFAAVEQMIADSNAVGIQAYSAAGLEALRPDLRKVDIPLPFKPAKIGLTTWQGMREEPAFEEFRRKITELAAEIR